MNFCKRIIILTDKHNSEKKGVLSCEQTGETLKCSLKTFGINIDSNAVLAIKLDGVMLSPLNILKKTISQFEFMLNNSLNLGAPISVVLATKKDDKTNILLSGGEESEHEQIETYLKSKQNLGKLVLEKPLAAEAEKDLFEYDEEEIEKEIEKIASAQPATETNPPQLQLNPSEPDWIDQTLVADGELKNASFFDIVREQIDQMFATFPKNDILSGIIENSKWINVDYDGRGAHYCFGLIFDDSEMQKPKYICYAVPSTGNKKPPQNVAAFCQWLPHDTAKPDGEGYYIMFQDATNGESIAM